jgi:hypothetical protein
LRAEMPGKGITMSGASTTNARKIGSTDQNGT